MTIEGAIAQLQDLIDNDGIPFWAKPSLKKVKETVEMEREQQIEERKTGRWVHTVGDEWECSECGYVISTEGSWEHPKEIGEDFCKHCGAKMEGAEE